MMEYQTGAALMERLNMRSREELLALLEQLMQRQSDIEPLIEMLIELPLVITAQKQNRPGRGRESTLDPATIESQVASAFSNAGRGWGAASTAAAELERLYDIGNSFAEAGEWANAQVVYATIVQGTIIPYESIHDEGQVSWILEACGSGLIECLEIQSTFSQDEQLEAAEREKLLAALFEFWKFGYNYGGINMDITGTIVENATEYELKSVEAWLRQEMRQGESFSDKWHNSRSIDFLAALKRAAHLSDDDLIEDK